MATKTKAISLKEKQAIITQIKGGRKQADIVKELGLTKSTVNSIWQKRNQYEGATAQGSFSPAAKRMKTASNVQLQDVLLD